jgi:hypothetical protein
MNTHHKDVMISSSEHSHRHHMKTTFAALTLALAALPAFAQTVKITPVGSHPGELCANDRAMIFEDPTGVRLLYDPAHNLTGGDDPRLEPVMNFSLYILGGYGT